MLDEKRDWVNTIRADTHFDGSAEHLYHGLQTSEPHLDQTLQKHAEIPGRWLDLDALRPEILVVGTPEIGDAAVGSQL
jgi:hypothetical protein